MSYPIWSSTSFESRHSTLLDRIGNGEISNLKVLKNSFGTDCHDKLIEGIKNGIYQINNPKRCQCALIKLLEITVADRRLHDKILAVCKDVGVVLNLGASSSSGIVTFSPIKNKVLGYPITTDIIRVDCLDQLSLQGGSETCAFHSLKNALGALALANSRDVCNSAKIFVDPHNYYRVYDIVCKERGETTYGDASLPHLRMGWKAILENDLNPFSEFEGSANWKARDLSFYDTAGFELTVADHDSLESLTILKQLSKHPGPCYHAFIVGGQGHWVTLFYEKNPLGKERWYGFDSISGKQNDSYIIDNVRKIKKAMAKIDLITPKHYYNTIGGSLEKLIPKIGIDESTLECSVDLNILLLRSAGRFMKEIGWLDHPPENSLVGHYIHTVKSLSDYYEIDFTLPFETRSLEPFEYQLCLLKAHLKDTKEIERFVDLPQFSLRQKSDLLLQMNSLNHNERAELFARLMELIDKGYSPLFEKMFAEGEINANWEDISSLIKMKVIPFPEDKLQFVPSFIEQIKFSLREQQNEILKNWFQEHKELQKDIILAASYELEHHHNAEYVRHLAYLIETNILLFTSDSESESYFQNLEDLLVEAKKLTSTTSLAKPRNPYRVYHSLKTVRSSQVPRAINLGDKGVFITRNQETIYHRRDIPSHLNRSTLNQVFDDIEIKMFENPSYMQAVYASLAEEYNKDSTYTNEECLKVFYETKKNFLDNDYMYTITQLPNNPNAKIPAGAFCFYNLFNYWCSLNSEPQGDNPLSEQELVILSNAKEINGCDIGRDRKIAGEYYKLTQSSNVLLPHPFTYDHEIRTDEDTQRKNRLMKLFQNLYLKYNAKVISIIHSDAFMNDLLGYPLTCSIEDPENLRKYISNRFGKLVGSLEELDFDRYTQFIDRKIFFITDHQFMKTFYKHAQPLSEVIERELDQVKINIDTLLLEGTPSQEISIYVTEGKANGLLFNDILYYLQRRVPNGRELFQEEYDENEINFIDIKLKSDGMKILINELGILRPQISDLKVDSYTPFEGIYELIDENKPIMTLNLSHCTWLKNEEIIDLIRKSNELKVLNLSGCTQLTDEDIDEILSKCQKIEIVDLTGCRQLKKLKIPFKPKLILNDCSPIQGKISIQSDGITHEFYHTLENEKDYSDIKTFESLLVAKYPEKISESLKYLGYTIDEAIQFCIEYQIRNIDLRPFQDLIKDDHIIKLSASVSEIKSIDINSYNITNQSVIYLVDKCPYLNSINLSGCTKISDDCVKKLIEDCHQLNSIDLSGCYRITDSCIEHINHEIPILTSINLARCENITDNFIISLARISPNLNTINLAKCSNITDLCIIELANKCHNLLNANFAHCLKISETSIRTLVNNCPNLSIIVLTGCSKVKDTTLKMILDHCRNLSTLEISGLNKIAGKFFEKLQVEYPHLNSIDLSGCFYLKDKFVKEFVTKCPNLFSINLSNLNGITDDSIQAIAETCHLLRSINLSGRSKISGLSIDYLAKKCQELAYINLLGCTEISRAWIREFRENYPSIELKIKS